MTARRISLTAAFLLLAAGSAQAQAPVQLRYKPIDAKLTYVMTDTTVNTMATMMGEMATNIIASGGYEVDTDAAGDSMQVTSKLTAMQTQMSAMGQEMSAPLPAGWDSTYTQSISALGVGRASTVSGGATSGASTTVHRIFLPLPEAAIAAGQSWTDSATVSMDGELKGSVGARTTGTWVSDTMVDGRMLNVLRYQTDYTIEAEGQAQGMDIAQKMNGQTITHAHFDPALGMMVMVLETGELTGKMNAPAAGLTDVDMKLEMRRLTHLQK